MDRRQFLYTLVTCLASLGSSKIGSASQKTTGTATILKDIPIIDTHSHPACILLPDPMKAASRAVTLEPMKRLGIVKSSFSAVGDVKRASNFYDRIPATYEQVIEQLDRAKEVVGFVGGRIVRTSPDISKPSDPNTIGAVLAVEGADFLEKEPKKIDDLYQYGVRAITLMHYRISQFGDIMTSPPKRKGLTREGRKIVSRMQELGIVVDVAPPD